MIADREADEGKEEHATKQVTIQIFRGISLLIFFFST